MICGDCVYWKCDDVLHLVGHCTVDSARRFHAERCDTCTDGKHKFLVCTDYWKEHNDGKD